MRVIDTTGWCFADGYDGFIDRDSFARAVVAG